MSYLIDFYACRCELGRQGTWPVDCIRKKVNDFLREFTIEAYYEKGYDRFGNRFREMIDNHDGSLLPELEREFHTSRFHTLRLPCSSDPP